MDEFDLYQLGLSEYSDMDIADFADMMGYETVEDDEDFYDEDEEYEDEN